jgi:hypothetical protein
MFCWPADAVRLPKSMFPLGSLNGVSRNTYELMRQIPEDRGHVAAASILIAGSEHRPKFMLPAGEREVRTSCTAVDCRYRFDSFAMKINV